MVETSRRRTLPDFVGIGASRSGTTWLYNALQHHRDVWVPPIKELHYFDSIDSVNRTTDRAVHKRSYRIRNFGLRRAKHYLIYPVCLFSESLRAKVRLDLNWDLRFIFGDGSIQWYQSLFAGAHNRHFVTGEITPRYSLLSRETLKELYAANPNIKIILLLRNPVERSWSSISKFFRDNSNEENKTVTVDVAKKILTEKHIFEKSSYHDIIERWESVFGNDNFGIFFFDDLRDDPRTFLTNIANFLGIEPWPVDLPKGLTQPINSSTYLLGRRPPAVSYLLASHYEPQLAKLRMKLGYPVTKWHDDVRVMLAQYQQYADAR